MLADETQIFGIDNGNLNYQDAYDWAEATESVPFYDDWRLPTQSEAEAIIGYVVEMAIDNGQLYTGSVPPDTPDAYTIPFWTSTAVELSETSHVTVMWDGNIPQVGEVDDTEGAFTFAIRTQLWED